MTSHVKRFISLDKFCLRQFDPNFVGGTRITHLTPQEFLSRLDALQISEKDLRDGYAPFCKHVFIENIADCETSVLSIDASNEHLLRSGYVKRTERELPVLSRWFPKESVKQFIKRAKYLDLILYSREQVKRENEAMGYADDTRTEDHDVPWAIVSIKAQDEDYELPMSPITMMRNALGKEEGGSGVPLDRLKYNESVKYWSEHAIVQ
jgi:hypothetical protein